MTSVEIIIAIQGIMIVVLLILLCSFDKRTEEFEKNVKEEADKNAKIIAKADKHLTHLMEEHDRELSEENLSSRPLMDRYELLAEHAFKAKKSVVRALDIIRGF